MDYSNESFESFQQAITEKHGQDSLLWWLRDGLFAEAFYGKANRLRKLFRFPGGWLMVLLALYLRERRGSKAARPESPPEACHYLFPSPRNNHMRRLLPMLESETGAGEACVAWYGVPGIPELAPESLRASFHSVAGAWTRHLRFPDFTEASRLTRELQAILPEDLDAPKLAAIRVYLVSSWHGGAFGWNACVTALRKSSAPSRKLRGSKPSSTRPGNSEFPNGSTGSMDSGIPPSKPPSPPNSGA